MSFVLLLIVLVLFVWTCYKAYQTNVFLNGILLPVQMLLLLMSVYTFLPAMIYQVFRKKIELDFNLKPDLVNYNNDFPHFILLIPAHNEALTLPNLIASIKQVDYLKDRMTSIIIADNCSDDTALIAQKAGFMVFERHTTLPSDKTQALRYGADLLSKMPQFSNETMVLVIDADCQLQADYLTGMADALRGYPEDVQVLQSHRFVRNAAASNTSLLDAAAEALRQRVNSGVRHWLGLENYLYGLGTGFRLPLFIEMTQLDQLIFADDKAWKAHLAERKIAIGYAPKAVIAYTACTQKAHFQKQRLRWVTGHYDMIKRFFIPMLWQGITRLNLSQLDFSVSIITLPRSFLVVLCSICCILATFFPILSIFPAWIWASTILAYILYAALGLYLIGSTRYYILLSGISLIIGVFRANCLSLVRRGSQAWSIERQ